MNGRSLRIGEILIPVALTLTAVGCRTTESHLRASAAPRTDGPISRVVVLWSEAVLRQDNVPVVQGFAGKVYFFGPDSSQPISAPGKFTIYAYDDTKVAEAGGEKKDAKPDRVWEIKESDLQGLLKKDAIGWCYSLWLPYDQPASKERRCTLILSFVPERGHRVLSESALVTLPAVRGAKTGELAKKV